MDEKPPTPPPLNDILANKDREIKSQNQSIFFKLPPEIRHEIYVYALGGLIHVDSAKGDGRNSRLGFLMSCGQIYAEAIEILYSNSILEYTVFRPNLYGAAVSKVGLNPVRYLRAAWLRFDVRLVCNRWCNPAAVISKNRLIFKPEIWEEIMETIMRTAWIQELYISLRDIGSPNGHHDCRFTKAYFASQLANNVFPVWNTAHHLKRFEVDVNWEVDVPEDVPFTLRIVERKR